MKNLIFPLLALPLCLSAQAPKGEGATPLPTATAPATVTRAVVIGISDYQSPAIPDLQFADKDAEAFAAWLKGPGGGNVPEENVVLLTNAQATFGVMASALDGLYEECKENDLAIIYFSGHGDVESKTAGQLGFLLPWDTPPRSYKAGAYSLMYLQDVISTLSTINKARVLVITDACHSGKLAGSTIGGAQTTATNLARQFASEIKIMSCQPDEFSLEGEQWGRRGVFSYYLVDGLSGDADQNKDGVITLLEIQSYLQANVPRETNPEPQTPFVVGDLRARVAMVDSATWAAVRQRKASEASGLSALQPKGREDMVLADADSVSQRLYALFREALEQGCLLEPAGASANDYFVLLQGHPDIAPLYKLMRRNFAAALQDEVQQALNALLESDPNEVNNWRVKPEKYNQYPAYLQRALELLGENHYLYQNLLAKKIFFETYLLTRNLTDRENDPVKREAVKQSAIQQLRQTIELDSTASYLYYGMGSLYAFNIPYRSDSLQRWMEKALELSPQWLLPLLDISYEYHISQSDVPTAEKWLQRALAIAPDSYVALERLSWMRQWQNRTEETIAICKKMIAMKPDLPNAYYTLACTLGFRREWDEACAWSNKVPGQISDKAFSEYAGPTACYFKKRQPDAGKSACDAVIAAPNSTAAQKFYAAYTALMGLYPYGRYEEVLHYIHFVDSIRYHLFYVTSALVCEAEVRFDQGRIAEAERLVQNTLRIDPSPNSSYARAYALLGSIAARRGQIREADALFQKSIQYNTGNVWNDYWQREEASYRYGRFLLDEGRLAEAENNFRQANEYAYANGYLGWYGLALVAARKGDTDVALNLLEKALDRWYPASGPILEEPLFKKLRKTMRFKALVAKHFPREGKRR